MQPTLTVNSKRIESIDLLKGLVMVVMALDHTRDYFHFSAFYFDPADPLQTTLPIFFTRWITHFCAPTFSFLAGLSAYMVGRRKSKQQLSGFLFKRGLWLVFIEFTIINFGWFFNIHFNSFEMIVIWSLGISMITLAALIHLPLRWNLIFSLLVIFGHDLLDHIHFKENFLWSVLHEPTLFNLTDTTHLFVGYPLIPWIAVMSLGYYFGIFYDKSYNSDKRRKIFNIIGLSAITLFFILRWINRYGDPYGWTYYGSFTKCLISFLNPNKYPPSLMYLLMTLGAAFLFLANAENLKGRLVNFFATFGRVPFFYYILHLYFIHLTAMLFAQLAGFGWRKMILSDWIGAIPSMKGYGFSLWVVYLVWAGIIILLYPLCKKFDTYKLMNKDKWWLSYL
ncbi:MAG: heparan-alpha-glucosaminide N-acetyltransferase domain-containing protein [Ferruginibacter sp.]